MPVTELLHIYDNFKSRTTLEIFYSTNLTLAFGNDERMDRVGGDI